jgi:hypothetical protein
MALVRAVPLKNFMVNPLSTTDVSTGYQVGGVPAGQMLYAGLHLTAGFTCSTDRKLSMVVQSATASAFAAPAARATFTLSTKVGAQWSTPAGGFSTEHKWWRASWTMSTAGAPSTGGIWYGLVHMGIK